MREPVLDLNKIDLAKTGFYIPKVDLYLISGDYSILPRIFQPDYRRFYPQCYLQDVSYAH